MAQASFYRCAKCGNIVALVNNGGGTLYCCGEPMEELVAGSVDAATEKHVPAVTREEGIIRVQVGSVEHPMLEAHSIQWIALATPTRVEIHYLKPGEKPETTFACDGATDVTVYEYCNLHGLWKADL